MKPENAALQRYEATSIPTMRDLFSVVFRQRWLILIALAIALVGFYFSGIWKPKFSAQMKILVRRQRSDTIVTASANEPSQLFNDQVSEEDLNSEVQLLNDEDLLRKVVISTGLNGVQEGSHDRGNEIKMARAVAQLSKSLKIEALHKSNIILVSYQSPDPQMAAKVLSVLATAYMEKHLEVHRSSGEFKFFDQQMQQYQLGLEKAQSNLTNFTQETGVVSADVERDSALRQADEFESAARQARSSRLEIEKRIASLQEQLHSIQPRVTTVVRTLDNSQLIDQSKSTLLNLQLKRSELLIKYAPSYPTVQEVDQQIEQTTRAIREEEAKPIREESSDRDPTFQWGQDELTKAQTELSGLKSRASSAELIASQYRESARRLDQRGLAQQDLVRAAKTQEENYLLYVHKREEARISDALDQRGIVNVAIAEEPVVPILPTKSPLSIGLLTSVVAALFSLSTAFLVDFMDPSFRTPNELADYLDAPVLGSLPKVRHLAG